MSSSSSAPLVATLLLIVASSIQAQPNNNNNDPSEGSFWKDSYKLGYTYNVLDDRRGPSQWSSLKSQDWGEWQDVNVLLNADTGLIDWGRDNNQCGSEERPSPIDIVPTDTCEDTVEMRVRQFNEDTDCRHPLEEEDADSNSNNYSVDAWEITPYSLRWYMPRTDATCMRPTLRLDGFTSNANRRSDEHFVLLWLELHARSEHVIDGKRYDAELQMVHMGTTRPNELVIVSVLIDADNEQEDNAEFQQYLLDGWQRKAMEEEETCQQDRKIRRSRRHLRGDLRTENSYLAALQEFQQLQEKTDSNEINLSQYQQEERTERKLQGGRDCETDIYGNGCEEFGLGPRQRTFPYNLWPSVWYYSYDGSLTAPPCTGQVHWRIIDTPLSISRRQYKQLTTLLTMSRDEDCQGDTATSPQGENFRPLQTAGGQNDNRQANQQSVAHCTSDDFTVIIYESEDQ